MVRYEVQLDVTAAIAESLEQYMRTEHIPGILATNCFTRIRFERSGQRFRTVYLASARAGLNRYLAEFADGFRGEFKARFPEGVGVTREIWEEIESWERAG